MMYLNGEFMPLGQFKIEHNDRGFLLSDGLFETMRVYNGVVFGLTEHYSRLVKGAEILKIPVAIRVEELNEIILRLLKENDLSHKDATLRVTLTRGAGPRGLLPPSDPKPTIMVTVASFPVADHPPLKLHISSNTRRNERSPLSNIKSLCYLDNVLAKIEAVEHKADDAIMLNTKDKVACATAGNIFIVTNSGTVMTPRLEDGILPGITRHILIESCKEHDIEILEKELAVEDIKAAKEIFITNSVLEIQPVFSVDTSLVNNGEKGEVTAKLQEIYRLKVKNSFGVAVTSEKHSQNLSTLVNNFKTEGGSSDKGEQHTQTVNAG